MKPLPYRRLVIAACLLAALVLFAVIMRGQSAPTWADRQTGRATLYYCVVYPAPAGATEQIESALREWTKYVQVEFFPGACHGDRTLTFSWLPADHGDWPLSATNPAHAHLPPDAVPEPLAGDVHFLRDYDWSEPGLICRIAVHEIGHSLGLWESREGLMNSERGLLWLQQGDIEAVRRLYARRCHGIECAWGVRSFKPSGVRVN